MAAILTGHDEVFAAWAAKRILVIGEARNFGPCVAVGVASGKAPADKLYAVVVFHDYQPKYGTCQVSVAAADPRWATRANVRGLLSIPFLQYKCHLVWVAIPHTAKRVIDFAKALGFRPEGTLADRFGKGVNAVILRMKTRDYERLYWERNDGKSSIGPAAGTVRASQTEDARAA